MEEQLKKIYEIPFLTRTENGAATMVGHLVSQGADIVSEGSLSKLKLSYPIKKEQSAYFGCITCNLSPSAVGKVHDAVRLDDEILRVMILTPTAARKEGDSTGGRQIAAVSAGERSTADSVEKEGTESPALSNELLEEKLEEILS